MTALARKEITIEAGLNELPTCQIGIFELLFKA